MTYITEKPEATSDVWLHESQSCRPSVMQGNKPQAVRTKLQGTTVCTHIKAPDCSSFDSSAMTNNHETSCILMEYEKHVKLCCNHPTSIWTLACMHITATSCSSFSTSAVAKFHALGYCRAGETCSMINPPSFGRWLAWLQRALAYWSSAADASSAQRPHHRPLHLPLRCLCSDSAHSAGPLTRQGQSQRQTEPELGCDVYRCQPEDSSDSFKRELQRSM